VRQAMLDAGLAPDAAALDFNSFLTLLSADHPDAGGGAALSNGGDTSRSLQKYASLAQHSVGAGEGVSLSGVVRRACSTHLMRGLSISQALSVGLSDGAEDSHGDVHSDVISPATSFSGAVAAAGKDAAGGAGTPRLRGVRSRAALSAVAEEAESCADVDVLLQQGDGRGGAGGGRRVGGTHGPADDEGAGEGNSEDLAMRLLHARVASEVGGGSGGM
jgi:hypothetical protein